MLTAKNYATDFGRNLHSDAKFHLPVNHGFFGAAATCVFTNEHTKSSSARYPRTMFHTVTAIMIRPITRTKIVSGRRA